MTGLTKKPIEFRVNAAIFDVDGTLIISQPAIAEMWRDFGKDKPYFDAEHVIAISHGWRTYDAIKAFAPEYADEKFVAKLEGEIPVKFGDYAIQVPGAVDMCRSLNALPKQKWAVGTSGTFEMASQWFKYLGIERPKVFITASDVENGKPNPEPYLKCRGGLGCLVNEMHPERAKAVVFEDAPAGIKAAKGARCKVCGIATTFDLSALKDHGCDIIIKNFESVRVGGYDPETDEVIFIFDDYLYAKEDLLEWK